MLLPLHRLPVGESAIIDALHLKGAMRRRLLDLGFTPGTRLTCLFAAPGGDPKAYRVRQTVIALRNFDAACLSAHAAVAEVIL